MVPKRCLICCRKSLPKKSGTQDANPTFPSAENLNCKQGKGSDTGDTELRMIFLLRKLLEIPESTCCLLREHFGNASVWIECCDSCLDLVEKCKAALEQAELFQKQYEELRSNIKTTMLKSPKKPFSAESKCEAIVRSHLITQEIDNFININEPETEENFPDGNVNFERNNSPAPVGSEDSEDSQVLTEFLTPVVIDKMNTVKTEDDIIISFNNVTENFINISEAEADSEIFQDGNDFDQNKLIAPVISQDTTEDLTGSIITPVLFEMINTVKSEDEISLTENDGMDCNLESSGFGNNTQSGNTSDCEQNNCERIKAGNLRKSANDNLDQFALTGKSKKSPRESKSSLNTTEEEEQGLGKRKDKGDAQRKHECHICLQLFKLPQHLRTHLLRSHSSTDKNPATKRKGNLRKHKSEKKHKCDMCNKSFRDFYTLKIHGRIHSGENLFVCDICGKGYLQAPSLKVHYRFHSGEKPFQCGVCGKASIRKSDLEKHQMTHSQKKPFKCDICGKSFKWKSNLTQHRKIHDKSPG